MCRLPPHICCMGHRQKDSACLVFVGLGSNLGERAKALEDALTLLSLAGLRISKRSSVFETPPWGVEAQPKFLNQVIQGTWVGTAEQLLETCMAVESKLGRIRAERYGPRTIDLDILAFGEQEIQTLNLQIPHPRLQERAFVLVPWHEVAPEHVVAGLGQSVAALLRNIPAEEVSEVALWSSKPQN